jgi:hypothetical protein
MALEVFNELMASNHLDAERSFDVLSASLQQPRRDDVRAPHLSRHERAAVGRRVLHLRRRLAILEKVGPPRESALRLLRDELSALERILHETAHDYRAEGA